MYLLLFFILVFIQSLYHRFTEIARIFFLKYKNKTCITTATNSIGSAGLHAWNQVQLDGKWYYIDCTWDDPTGGGHERTTYYLNENLWANHIEETSEDLVDNDIWHWENYYLTGEKWNK